MRPFWKNHFIPFDAKDFSDGGLKKIMLSISVVLAFLFCFVFLIKTVNDPIS